MLIFIVCSNIFSIYIQFEIITIYEVTINTIYDGPCLLLWQYNMNYISLVSSI